MELHYKITGTILLLLSLIHIVFPKYFKWSKELRVLSLLNRQMFYVHTFFIALTIFLMGMLCITSSKELIETHLGQTLSLGFGVFWLARLLIQFFGYSSKLWKGKTIETTIHILFSLIWAYFSTVFLLGYFQ